MWYCKVQTCCDKNLIDAVETVTERRMTERRMTERKMTERRMTERKMTESRKRPNVE